MQRCSFCQPQEGTELNIPLSTYRLQLIPGPVEEELQGIIDYLDNLGIKGIYASPVFRCRPGSKSGYDITDHRHIDDRPGGLKGIERASAAAAGRGLSWIQDLVPNHMALDGYNSILMDVLEYGRYSYYRDYFDIDWEHPESALTGRLMVPLLGKHYEICLADSEITIKFTAKGYSAVYYDLRLPLAIESYPFLLLFSQNMEAGRDKWAEDRKKILKTYVDPFRGNMQDKKILADIILRLHSFTSASSKRKRHIQGNSIKASLWRLYCHNKLFKEMLDNGLRTINGIKGKPGTFASMDRLLSMQRFALAHWKQSENIIDYRRFFTINDLICLSAEKKEVFSHTHKLAAELLEKKVFTGFRIDHIDGLHDPRAYLERLRKISKDAYMVVEKILAPREEIPAGWPVHGTTGYDFLNHCNNIFCDRKNSAVFDRLYRDFTGLKIPYDRLLYRSRMEILRGHMSGDVDNLAKLLENKASRHMQDNDLPPKMLREALIQIMAAYPVYRTYAGKKYWRRQDISIIEEACSRAVQAEPGLEREIRLVRENLLPGGRSDFIMRLQQFTGTVSAKGVEDTVFYRYNRLISLNEVGGDPQDFGEDIEKFHGFNLRKSRSSNCRFSLNTTSTHDTKRGEDARARINVLSEMPDAWHKRSGQWKNINDQFSFVRDGRRIPDANMEYFFYQTLLGAYDTGEETHEEFLKRIIACMVKAARENKTHTSWKEIDRVYEEALISFISQVMDRRNRAFWRSFMAIFREVSFYGVFNSISQVILKSASPGIPDFYQGSELWDFSLVDPDNRRKVDFQKRIRLLEEIKAVPQEKTLDYLKQLLLEGDSRIKLYIIFRLLEQRNSSPEIFLNGKYIPLKAAGLARDNIIAFARIQGERILIVMVSRFLSGLVRPGHLPAGKKVWKDTVLCLEDIPLKGNTAKDIISGEEYDISGILKKGGGDPILIYRVFKHFPFAVLDISKY
jgi:(1->4)-alpha-D-glucan 1-alpha-D-glucosylmutase